MALAYALRRRDPSQHRFERIVDITLDNSYPSPGGWAITAKDLGFGSSAVLEQVAVPSILDGYQLMWDYTNSKLKVFQGDNTNAAAAPGIELTNGSAVMANKVVRVRATASGQQT